MSRPFPGPRRHPAALAGMAALLVLPLISVVLTPSASSGLGPGATGDAREARVGHAPPRRAGYFRTRPVGAWRRLPSDHRCRTLVHRSTWEPRPGNAGPNHRMPDRRRVHRAFAVRPLSGDGSFSRRWDRWLLPRVTGHFTGTTDEIMQWAACKWGISDNVLRAIAVRESTWYQYAVYPSGRCVTDWGCGDMVPEATPATRTYCSGISRHGHDYQADYGRGLCPETFGIVGVMSWQAPSWDRMRGNQNGTFPFNRDSTAFALDYLGANLRGCYQGWAPWLDQAGPVPYRAGDLWGCVGNWYAGEWRTQRALDYVRRVRRELRHRTWLARDWKDVRPGCSPTFGCPRGT